MCPADGNICIFSTFSLLASLLWFFFKQRSLHCPKRYNLGLLCFNPLQTPRWIMCTMICNHQQILNFQLQFLQLIFFCLNLLHDDFTLTEENDSLGFSFFQAVPIAFSIWVMLSGFKGPTTLKSLDLSGTHAQSVCGDPRKPARRLAMDGWSAIVRLESALATSTA